MLVVTLVRAAAIGVAFTAAALWLLPTAAVSGQARGPSAQLITAPTLTIPSLVDSNTPVVWERVDGQQEIFVFTSESGVTTRLRGPDVTQLESDGLVAFVGHPGYAVWIESIIPDVDGTWYGYYHNEWPAHRCDDMSRAIPRIGAVRSRDFGATWQDLGIILEAPRRSEDCASVNGYFMGGVGDFSAILDREQQYLYIFFSQYANRERMQGVSVARVAWADRDTPLGKVEVWQRQQTWLPGRNGNGTAERLVYPMGVPIYRALESWHASPVVDAYWGPAVHWNTYLQRYVMLLNRAQDAAWAQEGIYVAFARSLANPGGWSAPQRLMTGGMWYPQVIGTEIGTGTDREAGERARLFLGGTSDYIIQFVK